MPPPLLILLGWHPMLKYNTCAHARPRLHPFTPADLKDHDPVYPVAPCCKKAVSYKVAEPRSYISAIPDRDRCESCPMFTDPDTLISMQADTFHADIYMDRLLDLPVTNIRKLIKLILSDTWANAEAVERLTAYLENIVEESKQAWKLAFQEYVDNYRSTTYLKSYLPKKEVAEITKNNKRLTRKVRAAKARHDRWAKIQSIWADARDTKHPMN